MIWTVSACEPIERLRTVQVILNVIFTYFCVFREISRILTFLCWNRFPPGTPVFPIRLKVHAVYFDYLSI
jgi:hypothetical protein